MNVRDRLPRYVLICAATAMCTIAALDAAHASAASSPSTPSTPVHAVPAVPGQPHAAPAALPKAHGATSVHALTATGLATTVSCGQTITKTVTLDGDLNCSRFVGIVLTITANTVTVNLNGFTVYGNQSYDGVWIEGTSDILEKGTITGAKDDVVIVGMKDSVISAQVSNAENDGVYDNGQATKITTSTATFDSFGIESLGSGEVYTSDHELNNHGGVYATGPNLQVIGNVANGNSIVGIVDLGSGGTLKGNTANFNAADGIVAAGVPVIDGGGNTAKGNDYTDGYAPVECQGVVCS
jgi:hypothetical protein